MHKSIRPALATCACALIALGAWSAHAQTRNPRPKRIAMGLDCRSIGEHSRGSEIDCHSFDIFAKKAFFDTPLPYRLRSHAPGVTTWPVLSVTVMNYRMAEPAPDKGEDHYRWDFRSMAFWSLTDAGQTRPYLGDWLDVSSGREFFGGPHSAQKTSMFRNPLFQAVAGELPSQLHAAYRRVHAGDAPAHEPPPPVSFSRKGAYQGACQEHFGSPARQNVLETASELLGQTLLFSPNLQGAEGPWEALLLPCAASDNELVLRMRGKGLRAEAACTLEQPLTLSDGEGITAQCLQQIGGELRKQLVAAHAAAQARK